MSATILVLEDDVVLQDLLREVLHDEGFQVITGVTLSELLKVAPKHADLLITDMLVDFKAVGLDAVSEVRRATRPDLPVIICSAAQKQLEQMKSEIARLNVRLLEKPFTLDELIGTVNSALQLASPPLHVAFA